MYREREREGACWQELESGVSGIIMRRLSKLCRDGDGLGPALGPLEEDTICLHRRRRGNGLPLTPVKSLGPSSSSSSERVVAWATAASSGGSRSATSASSSSSPAPAALRGHPKSGREARTRGSIGRRERGAPAISLTSFGIDGIVVHLRPETQAYH